MSDTSTNGFSGFMQRNQANWDKRLGISTSARERFLKKNIDHTDNTLLDWYMKGFNDELEGSTSVEPDDKLLLRAYRIGALDALCGDDKPSLDYSSNEHLIRIIRNND